MLAYADRVRPGERLGQAELVGLPRRPDGIAPRDIIAALAAGGRHFLFIEGGGITISRFLMPPARSTGCRSRQAHNLIPQYTDLLFGGILA